MFRTLKLTAVALTLAAMPAVASAQGFFSPFGSANGRCGTSYNGYGATPYVSANQYGNVQYGNQGILPGGCYGGACRMPCGPNMPCAQHGVVDCQQCQNGVCRQVPCAQHGVVNCPQCQGGLNFQGQPPYNLNFTGSTNQPIQNPYFQPIGTPTNYGGSVHSSPASTPSTYSNGVVTLY